VVDRQGVLYIFHCVVPARWHENGLAAILSDLHQMLPRMLDVRISLFVHVEERRRQVSPKGVVAVVRVARGQQVPLLPPTDVHGPAVGAKDICMQASARALRPQVQKPVVGLLDDGLLILFAAAAAAAVSALFWIWPMPPLVLKVVVVLVQPVVCKVRGGLVSPIGLELGQSLR